MTSPNPLCPLCKKRRHQRAYEACYYCRQHSASRTTKRVRLHVFPAPDPPGWEEYLAVLSRLAIAGVPLFPRRRPKVRE